MTADDARAAGAVRLARWLDDLVRVPGTNMRFGLDPVLGLIPGAGDLAGGVLSGYIILTAARLGASPSVIARMGANVLVDAIFGTIPLLGDLFDAGWKANRRNARILEQHIAAPAPVQRHSRLVVALVLTAVGVAVVGAAVLSVAVVRWLLEALGAG